MHAWFTLFHARVLCMERWRENRNTLVSHSLSMMFSFHIWHYSPQTKMHTQLAFMPIQSECVESTYVLIRAISDACHIWANNNDNRISAWNNIKWRDREMISRRGGSKSTIRVSVGPHHRRDCCGRGLERTSSMHRTRQTTKGRAYSIIQMNVWEMRIQYYPPDSTFIQIVCYGASTVLLPMLMISWTWRNRISEAAYIHFQFCAVKWFRFTLFFWGSSVSMQTA